MSKNSNQHNQPTLEEKITKLEEETAWFEGDEFSLDQALEKYQIVAALSKEIEAELDELENTITDINEAQ